jgi:hypothetical protein
MGLEAAEEHVSGLLREEVERAYTSVYEERVAVVQDVGVVGIHGREGLAEVRVENSAIRVDVVPPDESIYIILMTILPKLHQNIVQVWGSQPSSLLEVKHLEAIHQVEVCAHRKPDLGFL